MYIFRTKNGALVEAPKEFNPDNANVDALGDVEEIYCINKILIKQLKLVVKDKPERDRIRAAASVGDVAATTSTQSKPKRGKHGS